MTISENPEWFFGSLGYRLDPTNYVKAGWRALSCLWGSFVLIGLTLYGLWLRPKSLGASLLVGALATTLIFTKLVLIHRHYYLMFSPAVALLNTYAISALWRELRKLSAAKSALASVAILTMLMLSLLQGLMQIEALNLTADPYMRELAKIVAAHSAPDDRLVVINGGWGGDLLILSGQRGLSADTPDIVNVTQHGHDLQSMGYNKVIIASESPLLYAAQVTNPGSANRQRVLWKSFATEASSMWEDVYYSQDMVIKKLPATPLVNKSP